MAEAIRLLLVVEDLSLLIRAQGGSIDASLPGQNIFCSQQFPYKLFTIPASENIHSLASLS